MSEYGEPGHEGFQSILTQDGGRGMGFDGKNLMFSAKAGRVTTFWRPGELVQRQNRFSVERLSTNQYKLIQINTIFTIITQKSAVSLR